MSVAIALERHRREQLDRALLELLTAYVARAPLFAEMRARGGADDVVQDALIAVSRRLDGGECVADPHAYATRVVQNLARRAYLRAVPEEPLLEGDQDRAVSGADPAVIVEQRAELAEILERVALVQSVLLNLDAVDFEIVRAELERADQKRLATRLGMPRASFYRRKRHALEQFVAAVARQAGTSPCPEHRRALLAAASGSGFDGARDTRVHAESCTECAATLHHLTVARHGLGMLAPLPPVIAADPDLADRVGAVVHGILDWSRLALQRTPDPAVVVPSSKSVAAVVAAACVGVGGSTYCAVDGFPRPVRAVLGSRDARPHQAASSRAHRHRRSRPVGLAAIPARVATAGRPTAVRASQPPAPASRAAAGTRATPLGGHEFTGARTAGAVAEAEFAGTRAAEHAKTRAAATRSATKPSSTTTKQRAGHASARTSTGSEPAASALAPTATTPAPVSHAGGSATSEFESGGSSGAEFGG